MRLFVQLDKGAPKAWPLIGENIRYLAPANVSFPNGAEVYESVDLSHFGFETFTESEKPAHDPLTQKVVEVAPAKVGGSWVQQFQVVALTADEIAQTHAAAVPEVLTPRQFLHALNHFGFRSTVESAIAASDQYTKDWYARASTFERHHPTVIAMAQAMAFTSDQMDQVWTYGAAL